MKCEVRTDLFPGIPDEGICVGPNLSEVIRIHVAIINATTGTVTLKANSDLVACRTS